MIVCQTEKCFFSFAFWRFEPVRRKSRPKWRKDSTSRHCLAFSRVGSRFLCAFWRVIAYRPSVCDPFPSARRRGVTYTAFFFYLITLERPPPISLLSLLKTLISYRNFLRSLFLNCHAPSNTKKTLNVGWRLIGQYCCNIDARTEKAKRKRRPSGRPTARPGEMRDGGGGRRGRGGGGS